MVGSTVQHPPSTLKDQAKLIAKNLKQHRKKCSDPEEKVSNFDALSVQLSFLLEAHSVYAQPGIDFDEGNCHDNANDGWASRWWHWTFVRSTFYRAHENRFGKLLNCARNMNPLEDKNILKQFRTGIIAWHWNGLHGRDSIVHRAHVWIGFGSRTFENFPETLVEDVVTMPWTDPKRTEIPNHHQNRSRFGVSKSIP